ncbi:hypothetical protein [Natronorubrum daqingense]|uniref:Uncharacterized protein n=1 Tax=Natronorubrum daqingense TaxID=588898 RepID=A0A1N7G1Z0_9EURY|nr:hypothetical protein [Natronorubrum daqingense]APX98638.1 hypothetical protein BB347_18275 [Natronorubrum daqingense]SIS06524.1 hypothetical protein SAMN05421809_3672 [Natronorubrum daqingense]
MVSDRYRPDDTLRSLVIGLEKGEEIVVTARDKRRVLTVSETARHVCSQYQTPGYYLPLAGYGTNYTVCVPDSGPNVVRLRYPSNPGLGEPDEAIEREDESRENECGNESETEARTDVFSRSDTRNAAVIISDTTAADLYNAGPDGDFR